MNYEEEIRFARYERDEAMKATTTMAQAVYTMAREYERVLTENRMLREHLRIAAGWTGTK